MNDLSRLSRDAWMVQGMAHANGLDLTVQTRQGRISADDVSDVIQSCSRCAAKQGCGQWLATHDTPVETAPEFCRNKSWFDGLQKT